MTTVRRKSGGGRCCFNAKNCSARRKSRRKYSGRCCIKSSFCGARKASKRNQRKHRKKTRRRQRGGG